MKKTLFLKSIAVALAVAVVAFVCVLAGVTFSEADTGAGNETETIADVIEVKSPMQKSTYVLDNERVKLFYKTPIEDVATEFAGKGEQLPMNAVKLEWEAENAKYYEVYVADNLRFINAEKHVVLSGSLELNELIPNKDYYWKVKVTDNDGAQKFSKVYNFKTEGNVRSVSIDGVSNVRDLGGAVTADGRTIKYGILYRSANGDAITEKGKATVKRLGIKTDLDLRESVIEKSPFGDAVNVICISGAYYDGNPTGIDGSNDYRKSFIKEIKACANPDNYPMIFHCAIGRDRTGTLSLILQAMCGVDKDDVIREYMLSYLSVSGALDGNVTMGARIQNFCNYMEQNPASEGETFCEKVTSFVKSIKAKDDDGEIISVTDEDIASIRSILVG
mgnify:CR=1 FL=1